MTAEQADDVRIRPIGGAMPALFAIPLAALAVLLTLLTFPVSLPLIALSIRRDDRRRRAAAAETRCVRCARLLGPASLDAADDAWTAELARLRRHYPHHKLRIVRQCVAVCTTCGAGYAWNGTQRALTLLPDPLPTA